MDPITQGLLGGVAVQCLPRREGHPIPTWVGVLGAMAPDLDVLIRSEQDPLLFWEYHRHFTHSFAFIPIGGFLLALLLYLFPAVRRRYSFFMLFLAATVGWATHGILDAMTSYGTLLLWPFSEARIAWNVISIIDPIFTGILLLGSLWAWRKSKPGPARWALFLAGLYLLLGWVQHFRADKIQKVVAQTRGHEVHRSYVNPAFGNLLVWRSVYEHQGQFYVDALRLPPWGPIAIWEGGSSPVVEEQNPDPFWTRTPLLRKGLNRFAWFTQGFLTTVEGDVRQVGDLRYSSTTEGLLPIWGLGVENPAQPPRLKILRFSTDRTQALEDLESKLWGENPDQKIP